MKRYSLALLESPFNERDHPRDDDGKFARKVGGALLVGGAAAMTALATEMGVHAALHRRGVKNIQGRAAKIAEKAAHAQTEAGRRGQMALAREALEKVGPHQKIVKQLAVGTAIAGVGALGLGALALRNRAVKRAINPPPKDEKNGVAKSIAAATARGAIVGAGIGLGASATSGPANSVWDYYYVKDKKRALGKAGYTARIETGFGALAGAAIGGGGAAGRHAGEALGGRRGRLAGGALGGAIGGAASGAAIGNFAGKKAMSNLKAPGEALTAARIIGTAAGAGVGAVTGYRNARKNRKVRESMAKRYSLALLEKGAFIEKQHPRDDDGKFTAKGALKGATRVAIGAGIGAAVLGATRVAALRAASKDLGLPMPSLRSRQSGLASMALQGALITGGGALAAEGGRMWNSAVKLKKAARRKGEPRAAILAARAKRRERVSNVLQLGGVGSLVAGALAPVPNIGGAFGMGGGGGGGGRGGGGGPRHGGPQGGVSRPRSGFSWGSTGGLRQHWELPNVNQGAGELTKEQARQQRLLKMKPLERNTELRKQFIARNEEAIRRSRLRSMKGPNGERLFENRKDDMRPYSLENRKDDMRPYSLELLEFGFGKFDESKHPRGKGGKFASKGGGFSGGGVAGMSRKRRAGLLLAAGAGAAGAARAGKGAARNLRMARTMGRAARNVAQRAARMDRDARLAGSPGGRAFALGMAKSMDKIARSDAKSALSFAGKGVGGAALAAALAGGGLYAAKKALARKKRATRESYAPYSLALLEGRGNPGQKRDKNGRFASGGGTSKAAAKRRGGGKKGWLGTDKVYSDREAAGMVSDFLKKNPSGRPAKRRGGGKKGWLGTDKVYSDREAAGMVSDFLKKNPSGRPAKRRGGSR